MHIIILDKSLSCTYNNTNSSVIKLIRLFQLLQTYSFLFFLNFTKITSVSVGKTTFHPETCHSKSLLLLEAHSTDVLHNGAPLPHRECGHLNARRHTDLWTRQIIQHSTVNYCEFSWSVTVHGLNHNKTFSSTGLCWITSMYAPMLSFCLR